MAKSPTSRHARLDPTLKAVIVSRRKLRYRDGADKTLDRPAHVRAASGLAWVSGRLAAVQDDTNFIALIDPRTGLADSVTLPAGKHGLRQFDDLRGNKKYKFDFEACCTVAARGGPKLIAFGSGSKRRRRHIAVLYQWSNTAPRVSLVDADALYLTIAAAVEFAGSDMNIEGALALPRTVRLFGRGNGKPTKKLEPVNATCDLSLSSLLGYLAAPDDRSPPRPMAITQYDLGVLGDLKLGFTDATAIGRSIVYIAAAEDSASSIDDGPVTGSVIGLLPARGALRYTRFVDSRGRPTRDKVEGIAPVLGSRNRVYVVIDSDDSTKPSELCEVRLEGTWP